MEEVICQKIKKIAVKSTKNMIVTDVRIIMIAEDINFMIMKI